MALNLKFLLVPLMFLAACTPIKTVPIKEVIVPEAPITPAQIEELQIPAEDPAIPYTIDSFLGASPAMMQDNFGTPELVRRDGHMQIMQYHIVDCIIDIIFYEDELQSGFSAQHLSARTFDGARADPVACLTSINPTPNL